MSPNTDAINGVPFDTTVLILFPFRRCVNAGKKSGHVANTVFSHSQEGLFQRLPVLNERDGQVSTQR